MKATIKIYKMCEYYKGYPVNKLQKFIMKYSREDVPDDVDREIEKTNPEKDIDD